MSPAGQKVTTDPASQQVIHEAVGVVTSDSLAAESLEGSGSFGQGNPKAAASHQPSKSTTTNNTDTSAVTELPPAVDAHSREAQEGLSETAQLDAGWGLGKEAGVGPTWATTSAKGRNETDAATTSETGHKDKGTATASADNGVTGSGSKDGSNVPSAPNGAFAGSAELARDPRELKPKGTNITEGDFDSDVPNASFSNAEIGSKDDPGRAAVANLQLRNVQPARDATGGPMQAGLEGNKNTPYDALSSEQNA